MINGEYRPDWYRAVAYCTYFKNELFQSGAIKFLLLNRYFIIFFLLFSGENQFGFLPLSLVGWLLRLSVRHFISSCLIPDQASSPTNYSLTHIDPLLIFSQGKVRFDVLSERDIDRILDVERLELKSNNVCMGRHWKRRIDWMAGSKISLFENGCSTLNGFPHPFVRWNETFCSKWVLN